MSAPGAVGPPAGAEETTAAPARNVRGSLLLPFLFLSAVIADRAQLGLATGGRGALPLLAFVAPVVAILTVSRYGQPRSLRFLGSPIFLLTVVPYLLLTAVLPVLGIMINGYPERTLLSTSEATTALSFMVIGAAISERERGVIGRWLLVAIAIQLAYGVGQAVYLARGPGWELFSAFHQWDLAGADLATLVQARSTGLYGNPNELGLWAAVAAILAWVWLPGRQRIAGVVLALMTLLLSESRGAMVALAAAVAVAAVAAVVRDRGLTMAYLRSSARVIVAALVAIGVAVALSPQGSLVTRLQSLVDVGASGAQADANLAGRLDFWAAVAQLNGKYPFGTLGSPELLLGSSVDSSWFRAFGQGSVLYVAALGLLLFAAMVLARSPHRRALALVGVLIAVAGVTQTAFSYPVIVLLWALLGAEFQSSEVARHLARARDDQVPVVRRPIRAQAARGAADAVRLHPA